MSNGLLQQLADYGAFHDEEQGYVDVDDAFAAGNAVFPSGTSLYVVPRRSTRIGGSVAMAVAVLTILSISVIPLWINNQEAPSAGTIVSTSPVVSTPTTAPNQTIGAGTAELFVAELFVADLGGPSDVAFDSSGRLIILEHGPARVSQVEVLADGTAGETVTIVPDPGEDLQSLALDANGVVYYTNYDDVFRLSDEANPPTYNWAPFVGGLLGGYDYEGVPALAIDDDGDLYVAGFVESGIRITKVEVLPNGEAGTPIELSWRLRQS